MQNLLITLFLMFLMLSCSKDDTANSSKLKTIAMATTGHEITANGKSIAFIMYRQPFWEGHLSGTIGPAVVLLDRHGSTLDEGIICSVTMSGEQTELYTILGGKKVALDRSTCLIYNPYKKSYETFGLSAASGDRMKYIKQIAKDAYQQLHASSDASDAREEK